MLKIRKRIILRKEITVSALMKPSREVLPLSVVWEDGRVFEVDKILDIRPSAGTNGGGMGLRYRVRILGQEKFLYLDGYVWFIEV